MSNKIQDLAWETDLPMTRKIVLVSLADQANDRGESYPGLETIRRRCSMGMRTVYEALRELEDLGYLSRDQLPGSNTLYRIHLEKLQQQELPLRQAHPAAGAPCGRRTVQEPHPAGERKTTPAAAAPNKATLKAKATLCVSHAREQQLGELAAYDRQIIEPYLAQLPEVIDVQVFADFVKHRQASRRHLSISAWMQVLAELKTLAALGVDLNASLKETMAAGLAIPVKPRGPNGSRASPRPRANDDFSNVRYESTPAHELPPELRPDALAVVGSCDDG